MGFSTLEHDDTTGRYSLAYHDRAGRYRKPWGLDASQAHVSQHAMTGPEALHAVAGDFTVSKRPIYSVRSTPLPSGKRALPLPGHFALCRDDNEAPLGVCGSRYTPIQNARVVDLVRESGLLVDSLGVLGRGEGIYFQARAGEDRIRQGDSVETFLTVRSSHDGSSGLLVGFSMVNIVCANTLAMATLAARKDAVEGAEGGIKHTQGAEERLVNVIRALERLKLERAERIDAFRRLATTSVDAGTVTKTLEHAFPSQRKDDGGNVVAATRTLNVRNRVLEIFETAPTGSGVTAAKSAWDLWQAVTAYTSHESTVRGSGDDRVASQNARWLRSTLEGSEATDRAYAFLTVGASN